MENTQLNNEHDLFAQAESIVNDFASQCENLFAERANYLLTIQKDFNRCYTKLNVESDDKETIFLTLQKFHDELESELKSELERILTNKFFVLFNDLRLQITNALKNADKEIITNQTGKHFASVPGDKTKIKALKSIKRLTYKFDKSFRKNKTEYSWKRKVQYKNTISYYYEINLPEMLLAEIENANENYGFLMLELIGHLKKIDMVLLSEKMSLEIDQKEITTYNESVKAFNDEIDSAITSQQQAVQTFNKLLSEHLASSQISVDHQLSISGTLESKRRFYDDASLTKANELLQKSIDNSTLCYKNFFNAVFDRIEFYHDSMWFTYLLLGKYYQLKRIVSEYSETNINALFKRINDLFDKTQQNILSSGENLISVLQDEKSKLFVEIDKKLTNELIVSINKNGFVGNLEKYLKELTDSLNEFAKDYLFVVRKNLVYKIDPGDIKEFSPKDIISTTVLAKLDDIINRTETDYVQKINKLGNKIIGVGRVVEFNISSALSKANDKETSNKDVAEIAVSGIERAGNKSDDLLENYHTIIDETYSDLDESLKDVLSRLFFNTNIEQLLTVKIRMSKEKAMRELKENTKKYLFRTNAFIRWLTTATADYYKIAKDRVSGFTSKVGLTQTLNEQMENYSNYLLKTNETLNTLPYVYQQLFSNEQIFDERIFVGRAEEHNKLMNAYNYWTANHLGSAVIVGEKGSGTSSLINTTIKNFDSGYVVIRKEFNRTVHTKEELEKILSRLLKYDHTLTLENIAKKLNSSEHKIVLIIENLEDFFLRIINGFDVLRALFDLISNTQSNVFWLATCNLYAWNYLVKVVNINDYFSFTIKLNELKVDTTKEIILRRHNISGYDLEFIVPEDVTKQKSYIKMDENARQEYLQELYFEKLMKLSSDNIAIALYLWLRSIKEIDDERILITSEISVNTDYLKSLADDKIFTLMQLILHDGLSLNEHSLINNYSYEKSNLLLMALKDDGIVFVRNDRYKVNFQLYRPVVNLLKSKNILY